MAIQRTPEGGLEFKGIIMLPEGYTFVRPHIRGDRDGMPEPIMARARGLQTLSAMLKK